MHRRNAIAEFIRPILDRLSQHLELLCCKFLARQILDCLAEQVKEGSYILCPFSFYHTYMFFPLIIEAPVPSSPLIAARTLHEFKHNNVYTPANMPVLSTNCPNVLFLFAVALYHWIFLFLAVSHLRMYILILACTVHAQNALHILLLTVT
uniref:Uncharacterized protein n=1 Tax=Micrurus paraensis TaxID=1970185 RepID=A0A2D4KGF9_9SAUR